MTISGIAVVFGLVAVQPYVSVHQAFRDVQIAALTAGPGEPDALLGFASNIGVVLWCVAGTAQLVAAVAVARAAALRLAVFSACFGLFSFVLMADDFFVVHERILPALFGIDERLVFAVYAVAFVVGVIAFRREILRTGWPLIAIMALALSIFGDWVAGVPLSLEAMRGIEDGSKFVGIAFWCAFALRLAFITVKSTLEPRQDGVRARVEGSAERCVAPRKKG